ncbi:MAG: primosomal protein N', partial [Deltaproteobacteria bacterium]|nr:primosomal protein N' [Deltaproteobacteria bacterium]
MSRKKMLESKLKRCGQEDRYIDVAVAFSVHKTYTYRVPPELQDSVVVGKRVLIPFGKRRITGYIFGPSHCPRGVTVKLILDVLDEAPLFPDAMVPFFRWIADYYLYPVGLVIQNGLPSGLNLHETVTIELTQSGKRIVEAGGNGPFEQRVLEALADGPIRLNVLSRRVDGMVPASMIQSMVRAGKVEKIRRLTGGRVRSRLARFVAPVANPSATARITPQRRKILDLLSRCGEMPVKALSGHVPTAGHLVGPMAKAGLLTIHQKPVYRDPFGDPISRDTPPVLTSEQEKAVSAVLKSLGNGFAAYLLSGVTGSGKTEVYLHLAATAVAKGHSVLVLVPEIALISQMERRFRARFGDVVAVLHSGLSAGERYDQWQRILSGDVAIAVGTRSAVFAPFANLGLIVVDEEHDPSFKQDNQLRYNARDLAVVRAKDAGAVALLGSATPSVQSFRNAETGKFQVLTLTRRVENRPMPEIDVVDLKLNRGKRGIQRFITPELESAMRRTLARGEQVLLFLNRRGYANHQVCCDCGDTISCKNCDISLTLHRHTNALKCHYCGFSRPS